MSYCRQHVKKYFKIWLVIFLTIIPINKLFAYEINLECKYYGGYDKGTVTKYISVKDSVAEVDASGFIYKAEITDNWIIINNGFFKINRYNLKLLIGDKMPRESRCEKLYGKN